MQTHHWKVNEATLHVSPNYLNATIELQAKITDVREIKQLSDSYDLISEPIPRLGFEIEDVCKVGANVAYQIGYNTKILNSLTLKMGAEASVPENAYIYIDLIHRDKSHWDGWDAALKPIFDPTELSSSIKFSAYTQLNLFFGIELHKFHKHNEYGVELDLKIPQFATTITAGYSKHFHSSFLLLEPVLRSLFPQRSLAFAMRLKTPPKPWQK